MLTHIGGDRRVLTQVFVDGKNGIARGKSLSPVEIFFLLGAEVGDLLLPLRVRLAAYKRQKTLECLFNVPTQTDGGVYGL